MIDRFIAYLEAERRLSALTVRNYRHDTEGFAAWFCQQRGVATFDATAVCSQDISDWIIYRLDTAKLKAASMNRELSSIKSLFAYLRKAGVISKDPTARIGSLKTPKVLPTFVPESRMEQMLDTARSQSHDSSLKEQREGLIITLFYGCGIRLAELCAIKVGDINNNALKVHGKGGKERLVPLLSEIIARVERYKECCAQNGIMLQFDSPLIVNNKGKALSRSTIQRVVAANMTEANIQGRKSPHILRHTFATHLLNKGVDMREIQQMMGHSSLVTTQHYTHNSISQLQSVYDKAHPHK